jgi:hypothetical protein
VPGYVKVGGVQQPIAAPYVKVAGIWTPVAVGYTKVAGVWKIWHTAEIVDDFNRDNSASLGTASNDFSQWTNPSNNWGIQGNAAYCGSTNATSIAYTQLYKATTDYKVQIDIPSNTGLGVAFWVEDPNNWWSAIPGSRQQENAAYYSCPSGFTQSGTTCTKTTVYTATYEGDSNYAATANSDAQYACPSGYTYNGTNCEKGTTTTSSYPASCTSSTSYTCPSGYSGPSASNRCSKPRTKSSSTSYRTFCADAASCSGSCGSRGSCGPGDCRCTVGTTTYTCSDGSSTTAGGSCGNDIVFANQTTTYNCSCPNGGSNSGDKFNCTTSNTTYEYTSRTYVGQGPTYYTCPNGGDLSGQRCYITGRGYYCPQGGSRSGTTCTNTETQSATFNPASTTYPSVIRIYASVAGTITQSFTKDVASDPKSIEVSTAGSNITVRLYSAANLAGTRIDSVVYNSGSSLKARGVGIIKNGNQVQRQAIAIDNFKAE